MQPAYLDMDSSSDQRASTHYCRHVTLDFVFPGRAPCRILSSCIKDTCDADRPSTSTIQPDPLAPRSDRTAIPLTTPSLTPPLFRITLPWTPFSTSRPPFHPRNRRSNPMWRVPRSSSTKTVRLPVGTLGIRGASWHNLRAIGANHSSVEQLIQRR